MLQRVDESAGRSLSQTRHLYLGDRAVAVTQVVADNSSYFKITKLLQAAVGDPAGPENCAKFGSSWTLRKISAMGAWTMLVFRHPPAHLWRKGLGNSEKLVALEWGTCCSTPRMPVLAVVKHKGNASHVGITCPSWGALEGPAPAAHAKGSIVQGFRPRKGRDPLCGPHPGVIGAMP